MEIALVGALGGAVGGGARVERNTLRSAGELQSPGYARSRGLTQATLAHLAPGSAIGCERARPQASLSQSVYDDMQSLKFHRIFEIL